MLQETRKVGEKWKAHRKTTRAPIMLQLRRGGAWGHSLNGEKFPESKLSPPEKPNAPDVRSASDEHKVGGGNH